MTTKTNRNLPANGFVRVRGARQNNLRGIDVDIPRNAFAVFTGVSGSGKSSLAFGTIYAESQRRYFESINPYARRLLAQLPAPHVNEIEGLPPAVALQQRRAEPTARSTVGTLTKLSNSLRMLFSRAGTYPPGTTDRLDSDAFSANTVSGACPECNGMGVTYTVTEQSLVPDPSLSIRDRAIAAWPGAWQGKNLRDILDVLGYDVDKPWKDLSKKDREWILFTDERPVVTVHAQREAHRIQRPYQGTYQSAANYVLHTFANTNSATLRKRVARFMEAAVCKQCQGKRLRAEALAVKFAGHDISQLASMHLSELSRILETAPELKGKSSQTEAAKLLVGDLLDRITLLSELGLDYLSLDRSTPSLSAGELQRLRLTTQLRSGLFGVVYVLDEPSAGLHPADTESLLATLDKLQAGGNSLFVVDHELDIVRRADWIIDLGPGAGDGGGSLIYSGPVAGLAKSKESVTGKYLFNKQKAARHVPRKPSGWMKLSGVYRHNLNDFEVDLPLSVLTAVTGVSGSGKSTLISQVLHDIMLDRLGAAGNQPEENEAVDEVQEEDEEDIEVADKRTATLEGSEPIVRMVAVDQKPIGRTPRSNLATYTGLFDVIRKRFAATEQAKSRGYNAGRFSFNVEGGRCEQCEGEGFVSVELLFLPSVYSPCTACGGTRYKAETLEVTCNGRNIAEVLDMTVDAAVEFFRDLPAVERALRTLEDVGLGYLHLGQPATELSGGEAQRIKLATELQRAQTGNTLYLLDEPTTGLHPDDTRKLMKLLHALVDAGNTVIVVEHDMDVVAYADWVVDLGPGAGADGGKLVAAGTPDRVAKSRKSKTALYLQKRLAAASH